MHKIKNYLLKITWFIKKEKYFFSFFFLSVFIFLLWLIIFYPGFMSPDSLDQWGQVISFSYTNWHPYLSSVYLTFFARIFKNPASVGMFYIILTSGFFSYAFSYFLKKGISKKIIYTLFILFALSIPIGIYNITLWKDVPYSLSLCAIAFFLGKKYLDKESDVGWSKKESIIFIILSLVISLFRYNGLIYLFLIPGLILLFFRKNKVTIVATISFIILSGFLLFVFPKILKINERSWNSAQNFFAYHMGAGIYANQPITKTTQEFNKIIESAFDDRQNLKNSYDPISWNSLYWNVHVKQDIVESKAFWDQLVPEFYKKNLLPNIKFIISERVKAFFNIIINTNYYNNNIFLDKNGDIQTISAIRDKTILNIPENNDELLSIRNLVGKFILNQDITQSALGKIIWNLFVPIILLVTTFLLGIMKKEWYLVNYTFLLCAQIPALLVFNVSGDWRYFYAFYLSFFLTVPFLFYFLNSKYGKNSNKRIN